MTKMPTAQSQAPIQQTFDWINNRLDVADNHPSCGLEPSKGDLDLTRRVVGLSGIAQIQLLGNLKELMRKSKDLL